jgi:hypothetical protein
VLSFGWRWTGAVALIVLAALLAVASTHPVFNATADEPVHVAAGYDFLTRGRLVFDPEHPPLARAAFGAGLRLAAGDIQPPEEWTALQPVWRASAWGTELLWQRGEYVRHLSAARRANLIFLAIAIVAVASWARMTAGPETALVAAALFAALPPLLAHAGLATTDLSAVATLVLALCALDAWLARPTWLRAILLGLAAGLGLACKMSFPVFFGTAAVVLTVVRRIARGAPPSRRPYRRPQAGRRSSL